MTCIELHEMAKCIYLYDGIKFDKAVVTGSIQSYTEVSIISDADIYVIIIVFDDSPLNRGPFIDWSQIFWKFSKKKKRKKEYFKENPWKCVLFSTKWPIKMVRVWGLGCTHMSKPNMSTTSPVILLQ